MAMRDILELQEERAHKVKTTEDIAAAAEKEGRALTDTEQSTIRNLLADADAIAKEMDQVMEHAKTMAEIDAKSKELRERGKREIAPETPGSNLEASRPRIQFPDSMKKYGSLKAFKGPHADEKAYASGMWIRANLFGDNAAARWCRDNGYSASNINAAAGGNVNTAGGALVPDEFSAAIIDLREQYGVFRQECRVVPMGRDVMVIPRRTGGLTAVWADENPSSAITESQMTWNNVTLTAKKLGCLTRMSSEIADDAIINLADTLADEIAYAFANKEDDAGFNGDGTSTYGGIQGAVWKFSNDNTLAGAVDVSTATNNLFSEIDNTDLTTLMGSLPQYALRNAKFYCSQLAWSVVFERLNATAGGNAVNTLSGAVNRSYLGYPVVISQVMPAGAATDYNNLCMLLFGDLSMAAALGDRRQVTTLVSEHRYMDTDQVGIRGTERVDINVHDVGDATNAGPIVGLIGSSS